VDLVWDLLSGLVPLYAPPWVLVVVLDRHNAESKSSLCDVVALSYCANALVINLTTSPGDRLLSKIALVAAMLSTRVVLLAVLVDV
jgi:hypothetical protein